jgi:hypothetical protein
MTPERRAYEKEYRAKNKETINKYQREYRAAHVEQRRAYMKDYYSENVDSIRKKSEVYFKSRYPLCRDKYLNSQLKSRYGITLAERSKMLEDQGGCCAICKSETPGSKNWHVDHCHVTGRVRGILCQRCNLLLSNATDNPDTLLAAVAYLAR